MSSAIVHFPSTSKHNKSCCIISNSVISSIQSIYFSFSMSERAPALGIDLGTTYTCVAIFKDDEVSIIPDELGHMTMPSYVGFHTNHRVIGDVAKKRALYYLEQTVYDAKRLIGRPFDDHFVQRDLKTWPFKVINHNNRPKIEVNFEERKQQFWPEQISAMILEKVKKQAEAFLSQPVSRAVITVPAYFNQLQRQATLDAARIAGFEVYRLLSEPTAAALAYGLKSGCDQSPKKVLIYDLGGGTFDISILEYDGRIVDVLSTTGDTHLGGQDFDDSLVAHFVKEIKRTKKIDISENKRAIQRLRKECESLKRDLSAAKQSEIFIEAFFDTEDFGSSLTRIRFEDICNDLFMKTIDHVKQALQDAHLTKEAIDEVVLIGGSTRIPKIKQLLEEFFGHPNKIIQRINADEAVARGAAIQAAQIHDSEGTIQVRRVNDATNLSLGIETVDGSISVIVPKNTRIPTRREKHFTTVSKNQLKAVFSIYQGERPLAKDNVKLGEFSFDITRNRNRTTSDHTNFTITFEINENCILKISGREQGTGRRQELQINSLRPPEEVRTMIETAERHRQADEIVRQRVEARRKLENKALQLRDNSDNIINKDLATSKANEILTWIETHPMATTNEFQQQLANIDAFLRRF